MINLAHKGDCDHAPENTLSAFYIGLVNGANGFETDVCRAADGELVLFHDSQLDRLSDGTGLITEHTVEELKRLKIRGNCCTGFYDRIPTYREFLENFAKYDIHYAIELSVRKDENLAKDTILLSQEYGIMEKATFTSFFFENLERAKAFCPTAKVGWLVHRAGKAEIEKLHAIGGEEICPRAQNITPADMEYWHSEGLAVRAWGVTSIPLMKKMCELGVDGMTIDFPGTLCNYSLVQNDY